MKRIDLNSQFTYPSSAMAPKEKEEHGGIYKLSSQALFCRNVGVIVILCPFVRTGVNGAVCAV